MSIISRGLVNYQVDTFPGNLCPLPDLLRPGPTWLRVALLRSPSSSRALAGLSCRAAPEKASA